MKNSEIIYSTNLPKRTLFGVNTVLVYDSNITLNRPVKDWVTQFEYRLPVKAGEKLKSVGRLEEVLNKITNMNVKKASDLTFVSLGGGSVGDFVGFMASVYMRGRNLVHIPSTWLAALDSSHGGKTALNLLLAKNQIGTFYPASKIYICKNLLEKQPAIRALEAMGELIKISIINDEDLFNKICATNNIHKNLYHFLPSAIEDKYKIVNKDPLEKKGLRKVLNLGHTLGHVIEATSQLPHGICVLMGIRFSLRWSFNLKYLSEKDFIRISVLIDELEMTQGLPTGFQKILATLSAVQLKKYLRQDKKIQPDGKMDFIFIKKVGSCFRAQITFEQIFNEVRRQKKAYV